MDHTQYDTTSILKTIETRWNLAPLGTRDATAAPLTNAFDFHADAVGDPVAGMPRTGSNAEFANGAWVWMIVGLGLAFALLGWGVRYRPRLS